MTPRLRPESPTFQTDSEREVWELLRDTLPDDAILIAGLRITDEEKDHEADLIVLWPHVAVIVLEVKGGSVSCDVDSWWQQSRRGRKRIAPVDQARTTKYAIRDYVAGDARWSRRHVAWVHGVIAPYSDFPDDFAAPDCPRWAVHGRRDMATLVERLRDNGIRGQQGKPPPSHVEVELISEILRGRGFTNADRNAEALDRLATADRLTMEQATLLKVTRLINRVEVRGGAGSGKTVLALAQAKQLSAGRSDVPAQRVALLCYSIGLARFMQREVETWPRRQRPAFVGTYAELGRRWGAPDGDREDSAFWEQRLPQRMAELADELPDGQRFDAFIVDEAQDFADSWWTPLVKAMRDEEAGGLFVYSDERQRVFARFGRPPVPLVPLVLDHNLRNTRQIYDAFSALAPTRMTARGGEGVDVHFVPVGEDAFETADEAVDVLLDVGWHPGNITLLTTGSRHWNQVRLTDHLGLDGYWSTYWDDEVFYGHVLGCKGLERPAVVLCVNENEHRDRSREKLYVGMSRATDQLIVVGDPDVVREIGGPGVAGRLGLG